MAKPKLSVHAGTSTKSHYLRKLMASFGLFLSYTFVLGFAFATAGMAFHFFVFDPYAVKLEAQNKMNKTVIEQLVKDVKATDEKLGKMVAERENGNAEYVDILRDMPKKDSKK